ncbi:hypothetical protein EON82_03065 [bacterium]|nr:MAG: hypothetical protein EON82_03065 [bacterium]
MRSRLVLLVPFALLAGCSDNNGELSKKDDQELRNNFARALTPEEQAQMGKSKPAARPPR